MADVVLTDDTRPYDGRSLTSQPLGATESSVIHLARELARRGHNVIVFTPCERAIEHDGVRWRPMADAEPGPCDLYIAVQHPELLSFVKRAARRAIWVVWQPSHLEHYARVLSMWRYRPVPVLTSLYQARIYSPFPPHLNPEGPHSLPSAEGGLAANLRARPMASLRRLAKVWGAAALLPRHKRHIVIPLGLPDDVRGQSTIAEVPAARAIFASNPVRNLHRLVEIWAESILPRVPAALLDIYGVHDLGNRDPWQAWEGRFLPRDMPAAVKASVRVHPTVSRPALIAALRASRAMLYLGHECEAFCMALAEAQALGVPAVVAPIAALPERVIDGVTGFHRSGRESFAAAAVSLLTDDALWRRQHEAALRERQGTSWPDVAARFERALLGGSFPAQPD